MFVNLFNKIPNINTTTSLYDIFFVSCLTHWIVLDTFLLLKKRLRFNKKLLLLQIFEN